MSGDSVTQFGNFNIGIVKSQGPLDARTAHAQMVNAALALRGQVQGADQAVIDDSLSVINHDGPVDRQRFRQALANIGGIAALVGGVGVPVIEAISRLMEAFGLQ
ncbi:hypothetical protein ACIBJC_25085 [Streptomyces sp. NPDC050509]|uniref:hypothetical protein n=1 Tax=Streptomyces sp. NPDC050509 TaxID=3365620 RepID=UPI0037A1A2EC